MFQEIELLKKLIEFQLHNISDNVVFNYDVIESDTSKKKFVLYRIYLFV